MDSDDVFLPYDSGGDSATWIRMATEDEKEKLFEAIERNSYEWIAETNTFKLVETNIIKEKDMEEEVDKAKAPNLIGEDYSGKRFGYKIPNGYEFDCVTNNEIILRPKQFEYPKTYEECCEVLRKSKAYQCVSGYKTELLEDFQKVLICRDAYWKIASEEMGLGKPWEPNYGNDCDTKYIITVARNEIYKDVSVIFNYFLIFPTEEMRDTFYENFKDLIEQCKEFI